MHLDYSRVVISLNDQRRFAEELYGLQVPLIVTDVYEVVCKCFITPPTPLSFGSQAKPTFTRDGLLVQDQRSASASSIVESRDRHNLLLPAKTRHPHEYSETLAHWSALLRKWRDSDSVTKSTMNVEGEQTSPRPSWQIARTLMAITTRSSWPHRLGRVLPNLTTLKFLRCRNTSISYEKHWGH